MVIRRKLKDTPTLWISVKTSGRRSSPKLRGNVGKPTGTGKRNLPADRKANGQVDDQVKGNTGHFDRGGWHPNRRPRCIRNEFAWFDCAGPSTVFGLQPLGTSVVV